MQGVGHNADFVEAGLEFLEAAKSGIEKPEVLRVLDDKEVRIRLVQCRVQE